MYLVFKDSCYLLNDSGGILGKAVTLTKVQNYLFSFDVENIGTQSVDASLVWSSVPAGVTLSTLNGSISLATGEITTISVLIESEQSAVAINSPVSQKDTVGAIVEK